MKTAAPTARTKERSPSPSPPQGSSTDFWFERSQSYSAVTEFTRRVLTVVEDDGGTGSALREAAIDLTTVVAAAVSTARDQLPVRLQEAVDRSHGVAGLLVLHMDLSEMPAETRAACRENLSAVAGLLFGLRRSITQDR